jgi:dolichol-phosphate mannosyltransferase
MVHISVVVPMLNEETIVEELVTRVKENLKFSNDSFEIILVDDGSSDGTWKKITEKAKNDNKIRGIRFSRNFGHHYAITSGLDASTGEWVVVMDGDLQDRPEVIPELYAEAVKGFDLVFVSRRRRPESIYYRTLQKIFYVILRMLSGIHFDSTQANFSILSRKVVDAFKLFPENARFYGSTINWLGFSRSKIYADHGLRFSGKPSYSFKKRVKLAADVIFAFSDRALWWSIYVGLIISMFSFILLSYILVKNYFFGFEVVGWASVIASIYFVGGIVLTVLGILGIYIGKIFNEVKRRPLYVVKEVIN